MNIRVSREDLITLGKYAIKLGLAATLAAVIAQKLHLNKVTSISFGKVANAVKHKQFSLILPDLEQACYVADKQI